jgi:hypothetical protein
MVDAPPHGPQSSRDAIDLRMGAMMTGNDDDEIAKWLKQKGATQCPPRAAHELGETSPGWRRNVERKSERAQSENVRKRQQKALRERAGLTDNEGDKPKR